MKQSLFDDNEFPSRHIGPQPDDLAAMLRTIGVGSIEQLIDETVPERIRRKAPLNLEEGMSEHRYAQHIRGLAAKNTLLASYLGQGYSHCIVPPVIQRNILENPGWYTQYTPYQPEIAQGRLEALLNFQTMVADLTGMEVANASLLDEATAAAEAMTMAHGIANKSSNGHSADTLFVSDRCFAQTIDVVRTRAEAVGITVVVGDHAATKFDRAYFAVMLQYPDERGAVQDYRETIERIHALGGIAIVATDLLSLALLKPPGEFGADIVVGNSQRFGVPLGYGGPHAAFFATRNEFVRSMPGRIIGVSIDAHKNRAYRMTLQTREQHIRREKATSNICTAQALLAIMAGMYGAYHGPNGIKRIAMRVHTLAALFAHEAAKFGFVQSNESFFDTLVIESGSQTYALIQSSLEAGYNIRRIDDKRVGIAFDETTTLGDVAKLVGAFAGASKKLYDSSSLRMTGEGLNAEIAAPFRRLTGFMTHPVFNTYHSESEMMRYIKSLENKDLSLTHSMIPLGSCTMKLNAAAELMPVSWREFGGIHPFVPRAQAEGYAQIFTELEQALCEITGFAGCSLQPNSGAQGEFTGLLVIRAYHHARGDKHRTVALIPSSAHGTNPASAVMAGMKVVVVNCDAMGNIDVDDLRAKAGLHKAQLSCLMATYPSTHGVYEERIKEICAIVHENGGQVYMDGANLNAQVGLTSPAEIGADVCHINLHKTFAIPHGGGGPGMGPICVANHLVPYLPGHPVVKVGGDKAIRAVSAAPYASSSILLISYTYIKMLGAQGVVDATRYAILNANYLKARLEKHFSVLYQGAKGRVAHEFILTMKEFKDSAGVEVEDIAKRLMDYGFHAPTVSFPVAGTLMIEPTESESKAELDRFADALIAIRNEILEIADGKADRTDNVLKNAPHTAAAVSTDEWTHPYSRHKAAFPASFVKAKKFWPSVGRINSTYGDRNIVCSCPPIEEYADAPAR